MYRYLCAAGIVMLLIQLQQLLLPMDGLLLQYRQILHR